MKLSDTRWQIMTMGLVGSFFALTVAFFSFQSITSRASPLTTNPLSESTPEALQKQPVYLDKRVSDAFKIQAKSAAVPTIDVLIYLQRPLVKQRVIATKRDERRTQRTEYVNALRSRTDNLQQQVRTALNPQIANKSIVIKRSFFIDNILHASITEEGLKAIQNSPGVIAVVPNEQITLPPQATTTNVGSWNITKIAADRVWNELNLTGNGVVVANIDTGVQWDHPALKNAYRGWDGTTADHNYNWYDPGNTSPLVPLDNIGHGTHTMGTIVGFDGTTHIGIAPGAKWIAAKGCINNGCSQSDLLAAGQWMLAPTKLDGTNPDPSKAPDVVNNSWGGFGCNAYYKGVLTAWRNAGIVPIFSSGNSGPNPNTVGSPGDNPEAISVGATDESDAIASFSSKGPSCATFNNNPKPDIAAPGVAINSSIPYDSYMTLNGTSMAAPNATGVVALLLQAKPNLSVYEIEQVLKRSSTDLGATGTDNTFGAGLINAYNAVTMDTSTIPTPTPTPLPPQVKITSPNGGETFQYGQTTPITWTAQGVIEVYLSLVDVTNNTIRGISLSLPNSGSYNWTITDPKGTYNTKYKVRIEAYPNSAWIYDDSDASFTISGIPTPTPQPTPTPTRIPTPTPTPSNTPIPTPTPTKIPTPTPTPQPFLDIVQPSGGETLYESQQYQVKWSTNITGNVGIYLMKEDGMGGTPLLVTVPADQQSYTWTVSKNIFTAASRFKIWIHNGIVGGQSASGFTVLPPQPTPTNTPTPTQIPTSTPTPTPACTPRLPCMDPPKGQEACMVKAPAGTVFCPVTPTPTPATKVSCITNSDCGCGLDLNSNACAIQNTQFLKAGRCTVPDFCTGISGKCGPSCVSGQCQLTCPPQNGKQTATTNESPSFTTKSLARVSTRRPYLGAISAMDKDRDAMKMTINGLPNGLRQGICTQGIYPVQPFGSTLTCAITGTTTSVGVFTVTATVKDARGSTTKSTFTLLSLPW